MDGLLVVDKPVGPTSHDVVVRVRRALGERRIGHTGTLDPAASGVLPLVLGRATRLARFLSASDKTYDAVVRLGVATDTHDAEGLPVGPRHEGALPTREAVDRALDAFRGPFLQQPPEYSAKKVDGRRSYQIARARAKQPGLPADAATTPAPVMVTAHAIEVTGVEGDRLSLRVHASAGFYVRALARDLGDRLGVGAHLCALRRTRSGDVTLDRALPLESIEQDTARASSAVIPTARMLPGLASVTLTQDGVRRAACGRDLGPADLATPPRPAGTGVHTVWLRLVDPAGDLVAIATPAGSSGLLHPAVVLV